MNKTRLAIFLCSIVAISIAAYRIDLLYGDLTLITMGITFIILMDDLDRTLKENNNEI